MIEILLRDIDQQLQTLKSEILTQSPPAFFQQISFATHQGSEFIPPHVVDSFTGRKAIAAAASAYCQLIRQDGQEPLSVFRACGIVAAKPEVCHLAQQINILKDEAKQLLTALPRRERDKVKKRFHPGLILNQLYRHIPVTDQAVDTVSCSWIYSGKSSAQVAKGDLIQQLVSLKEGRRDAGQDIKFIDHDLEKIMSFPPQHHFKMIRKTRPHPKYKIKNIGGDWFDLQANLPLIVSTQYTFPEYRPLKDLVSNQEPSLDLSSALIPWLGIVA